MKLSALEELLGQPVQLGDAVGGGDIAQPRRACTEDGTQLFVKSAQGLPWGWVAAEAAGLDALAQAESGLRVPRVVAKSDIPSLLVLEWVEPGQATPSYWEALGRGLALQHRVGGEACGFASDGFLGRTPQVNAREASWPVFFRDQRLHWLHGLLREAEMCTEALSRDLDAICGRMEELLPEPAAGPVLLHGDFWSGNAMPDSDGQPVVYDPAVYFGSREADLAMTRLFGGFEAGFYGAYQAAFPLDGDADERVDLLNLYHLLNHALMFGGGYLARCEAVAGRYA
jgi:fructosamine-3-kinase